MNRYTFIIMAMLLSLCVKANAANAAFEKNAEECVEINIKETKAAFGTSSYTAKNTCDERIFLFYCATVAKREGPPETVECGPRENRQYFYQAAYSIDAGKEITLDGSHGATKQIRGDIHYGACFGYGDSRKFKSHEIDLTRTIEDDRKGGYACIARSELAGGAKDKDKSEDKKKDAKGKKGLGPEQLEAVAVCWQAKKNPDHWRCDGPTQDTILADDTLEKQLGFAGCSKPRATDGSRNITRKSGDGGEASVHLCGYGLYGGDYDIVKKYGLTVQRNKYQCPGKTGKSHCTDNFQLTK